MYRALTIVTCYSLEEAQRSWLSCWGSRRADTCINCPAAQQACLLGFLAVCEERKVLWAPQHRPVPQILGVLAWLLYSRDNLGEMFLTFLTLLRSLQAQEAPSTPASRIWASQPSTPVLSTPGSSSSWILGVTWDPNMTAPKQRPLYSVRLFSQFDSLTELANRLGR